MDHSDNTASVGNGAAAFTAAITASTPTTSDNINSDNVVSVVDSNVANAAAVITGSTLTISDNTASIASDVTPVAAYQSGWKRVRR